MNGFASLFIAWLLGVTPMLTLENTAIVGCQHLKDSSGYNRLRGELELEHDKHPALLARALVDNSTLYVGDTNELENDLSIYRAYVQYRGDKHFWSLGRQRIPLGVGRVWNPIDIFNPIDSQSIETDERSGTESIRYEYAINELSNADFTVAKDKLALRVKGYLDDVDMAFVTLWDEKGDQDVIGWELAGELLHSGIELRSEGGSFRDHRCGERHSEFIIGAEYGFANSVTLLGEYKHSDAGKSDYIATQIGYQPALLWTCHLLLVVNTTDGSGFAAPAVEYSLSDEMTLSAGAFVYGGGDSDEFGVSSNRYYLRWFVHF